MGKVMTLDVLPLIKEDKSWNEGMVELPTFRVGNWYWKQYTDSGLFDLDKKWQDYSERERNLLLYGSEEPGGKRLPCPAGRFSIRAAIRGSLAPAH